MKKIMYGTLLCALSAALNANIVSNQTFVRSRDSINNNQILSDASKARIAHVKKSALGATASVAAYYRQSHNTSDIARAFGGGQSVDNNQDGTLIIEPGQSANAQAEALKLYSGAIDHLRTESTNGMFGSVSFAPKRTEYGAHISLKQKLNFLFKGLTLHAEMPIVNVSNTLNAQFSGTANSDADAGQIGSTLRDYFTGKTLVKAEEAAQERLQYAKITNVKQSTVGIADLQIGAHYWLHTNELFRISSMAHVTIPTGPKTNGIYLFQPTIGGNHITAGLKTAITTKINNIHLGLSGDYRYSFKAEETRTLGLYNHWYNTIATGSQYRNLGAAEGSTAIPAANVLTRKVIVNPGHAFDILASARFYYGNFAGSLYYNLHAHSAEQVTLAPVSRWFDGEYGMLGHAIDDISGEAIVVGSEDYTFGGAVQQEGNTATITKDSSGDNISGVNNAQYYISTAACTGRADVTHKLAAIGEWQYRKLAYPITLSAGVEYEIPGYKNTNSGIHSWAAWSKISICF